jgi:hypothetical protein
MELLQLRYFLETAKNQSFTKTAEKFYVPTTSVSASIKRLEEEIDALDSEISELNGILSSPETSADYEKIIEYTNKLEESTAKQLLLMDEWEACNSRFTELSKMEV